MRVEALAGIVVALAALGEAAQHTEKQLGEVAEAVSVLPAQLEPVAQSAAAVPGLSVLIGADTHFQVARRFHAHRSRVETVCRAR